MEARYWVAVPAAGIGTRMGHRLPKQYLPLYGKTVIAHTLDRLSRHPAIRGMVVALAENDPHWPELAIECATEMWVTTGGPERCHSVLAALQTLRRTARPDDWVLVHDAARPCVRVEDIDRLIKTLSGHPVGGLLALPVRDTIKRGDGGGRVVETVDRTGLWHALTPQMFRLGPLVGAISAALEKGDVVTDEAQAMELAGVRPYLIEGRADNIKITRVQDLALAEVYLRHQDEEAACA